MYSTPELSPRSIMIDFEIASRNTLQEVFPEATIQGCFYHLSQAIYRKVQSIGLQQEYQTNVDLSLKIRMLAALAFVPVDDIVESFEHLAASMPDETQPITDYFEDTYIGRRQRHGRRQPPFAHTMWSVHNRVEEGLPRTNNHVEGWHRRMQSNVGAYHPKAFGIFLMCFVVNNPSTKSSSPRFTPANQHHHNVAKTRPSVSA